MCNSFWSWRVFSAIALAVMSLCAIAHGQVNPKWVEEANKRIDAHRKGSLRVLVLGRDGNPVANCPVAVSMTKHAFPFGVRLTTKAMERSPDIEAHATSQVWRAINALSLENVSSWPRTQPEANRWDFTQVDALLKWAKARSMPVMWGGLISEDRGRLPAWAAGLSARELAGAIDTHADRVLDRYSKTVTHINALTHTLDHRYITQKLGVAMQRRLYHRTHQRKVDASASFEDALRADRLTGMVRRITTLREDFIPFDSVSIGVTLRDSANPYQITRSLKVMSNLKLDIVVNNLEISATDESDVAQGVDHTLRAIFADPNVKGIYWAGLFPDELNDPSAALVDKDGKVTAAGLIFDWYVRDVWWTRLEKKTDALGNLRARVFAGEHELTARLPDGSIVKSTLRIAPGDAEQMIILQPLKAPEPAGLLSDGESR